VKKGIEMEVWNSGTEHTFIWITRIDTDILIETAEKEVQDTSCGGSGGVPQLIKSPKIGGLGGSLRIFQ
jgi:hypothetical protein